MANDRDTKGRLYANIKTVKAGDWLEVDPGFECMAAGSRLQVKAFDDGELYIECAEEMHFLDGQVDDKAGWLIGLYPVEAWKVS